ncbi:MAG: LLM class flavin-dependent oxidoreductase [Dehalococcoidia bacterium]|nr:LLM class flavin-dependent oxidoreductase [Dehalococcoidia bacterium]
MQAEWAGARTWASGVGDSALAHLGKAPVSVAKFEDYLARLQGYLRGEDVPFDADADVDALGLADRPQTSRMHWVRPGKYPKVPVEVTATGPKVMGLAAIHGDRVVLAVGADIERLRWGINVAREAAEAQGRDPDELQFGAYVNVIVHDDIEKAKQLGEGGISLFTRFSSMHGNVVGPTSETDQRVFEAVHDAYNMNEHSRAGSQQAATIPGDFAARFGVLGPASECIDRLGAIAELGIDRLVVVGPSIGASQGEAREAEARFAEDVLPKVKAMGIGA